LVTAASLIRFSRARALAARNPEPYAAAPNPTRLSRAKRFT
jgi:hypothetical protein